MRERLKKTRLIFLRGYDLPGEDGRTILTWDVDKSLFLYGVGFLSFLYKPTNNFHELD